MSLAILYCRAQTGVKAPLVTDNPWFYIALVVMMMGTFFFLTGFLAELINRNATGRNEYLIKDKI